MSVKKTTLLIIDPQCDFCIANGPGGERGALVVAGADKDMAFLAKFITKNKKRLTKITSTLDCHQTVHIAHPIFWKNSKGEHPAPFTVISVDDVKKGTWSASYPPFQNRALKYVETLATNKRYALVIWPPHCIIGSWGASIVPAVSDALIDWEYSNFNKIDYVPKGSNFFTEHYSGVKADVEDNSDPSTKLNTDLIKDLVQSDEIVLAGEALSHCMANTVQDIANEFGDDNIKKLTLLTDCSSSVSGFEKLGQDFVINMSKRGMKLAKSTEW
jgi:nicotinamidase-related amidase